MEDATLTRLHTMLMGYKSNRDLLQAAANTLADSQWPGCRLDLLLEASRSERVVDALTKAIELLEKDKS